MCQLAGRGVASFPRKLLGDPSLSREEVLISPKGAVDGVPLARRDVASLIIPKKAVGRPVPQQGGGANQSQGSC
jgi:hypothetical protein